MDSLTNRGLYLPTTARVTSTSRRMAEQHKKSKWGISSMLHKEKDRPGPTTDSTYGTSSEASSADPAARDSYTSAPSLTNSERSQGGYPGQQERQQTYVNDAGQTVTTTTTTTTTVTTGGGGKHDTSGPHTSNLANRLDPRVSSGSDYGNTEIKEVRREREVERPNIPAKSNMRVPSPNPPPNQQQQPSGRQAPQIQTHNMMRDRSPNLANPGSPDGRHNFSYPSRTPPPAQVGVPPQQNQYGGPQQGQYGAPHGAPQQQQPSTLQNLKTAAVGIHVGPLFPFLPPLPSLSPSPHTNTLPGRRRNPPRHHQLRRRQTLPRLSRNNGAQQSSPQCGQI